MRRGTRDTNKRMGSAEKSIDQRSEVGKCCQIGGLGKDMEKGEQMRDERGRRGSLTEVGGLKSDRYI